MSELMTGTERKEVNEEDRFLRKLEIRTGGQWVNGRLSCPMLLLGCR